MKHQPWYRWQQLLRIRNLSLILLFVVIFVGTYWITPPQPTAVIQLRDQGEFEGVGIYQHALEILQFSPDGQTLLLGRFEDQFTKSPQIINPHLTAWDSSTGSKRWQLSLSEKANAQIQFSPDSKFIEIIDETDEQSRVIDVQTGAERFKINRDRADLREGIRFSPHGRLLAFQAKSPKDTLSTIVFLDLENNEELSRVPGYISLLSFAPDGARAGTQDRLTIPIGKGASFGLTRVMLWNIKDIHHPVLEKLYSILTRRIKFASDLSAFAVVHESPDDLKIWEASIRDINTGNETLRIDSSDRAFDCYPSDFFLHGSVLLVMDSVTTAEDFNHPRFTLALGPVNSRVINPDESNPEISPDRRWIAFPDSAAIHLISVETGKDHAALIHPGDIEDIYTKHSTSTGGSYGGTSVQFADNGRLCLAGNILQPIPPEWLIRRFPFLAYVLGQRLERVARLWDTENAKEILSCPGAWEAVISSNGKFLAAYHGDRVVIWKCVPDRPWMRILVAVIVIWLVTVSMGWFGLWCFRLTRRQLAAEGIASSIGNRMYRSL